MQKKPLITKLRRQELNETERKEKDINIDFLKKYFTIYQSPTNVYNILNKVKNTKENNIRVNLIKSSLIDLKKDIEKSSKDDANKTEEMNKIADIA